MQGAHVEPTGAFRIVDEHFVNVAISNLTSIDSIQLLELKNVEPTARTFAKIGDLPKLTWLTLSNTKLNPIDVGNLRNLRHLKVLRLNKFKSVTPILKELSDNNAHLVRLALESCHVSQDDFRLISKLQKLQALDLHSNFDNKYFNSNQERHRVIDCLGKLSHLEVLMIDGELLNEDDAIWFRQCKKLRILYVTRKLLKTSELAQLKKALPQCQVYDSNIEWVARKNGRELFFCRCVSATARHR